MVGSQGILAACFLSFGCVVEALELPTFLASNMVLPRAPASARIWGTGEPGDSVKVVISKGGSPKTSPVAQDGTWSVELDPQPAGIGFELTIADSRESKVLTNLAFGDLWLCSGQSNMEFSVSDAFDGQLYINYSANRRIRLATVAKVVADEPLSNASSKANYTWSESKPSAFSPAGFSWPSAVCYFFGINLFRKLGGSIPLGLIGSDWGGQTVEAFSSPDALADKTCGGTQVPADVLRGESEDYHPTSPAEPNPGPSQLWNGMIHPLLNFKLTGVIWYQGEANAGNPVSYACRFPAMIADWRKKFDQDFAFLFVVLAAYRRNWAEIRNAQMAALQLPRTGYATATDLGDPTSPQGDIHPRRKLEVGRRLALAAAHIQYGHKDLGIGPRLKAATRPGGSRRLLVSFEEGTADGLHSHPTAGCKKCCSQSPFEVEISGKWHRVRDWVLSAPTVVKLVGQLSNATAVRFNWEGYPQCTLYNGMGGPDDHTGIAATPFKTELPKLTSEPLEVLV